MDWAWVAMAELGEEEEVDIERENDLMEYREGRREDGKSMREGLMKKKKKIGGRKSEMRQLMCRKQLWLCLALFAPPRHSEAESRDVNSSPEGAYWDACGIDDIFSFLPLPFPCCARG